MKIRFRYILLLLVLIPSVAGAMKPRLVVNIVVSQMRYDYLTRFERNFTQDGFRRFMEKVLACTDERYDFMETTTPAALATITTGANPSMHGVVSERWIDYTNNNIVTLIGCSEARGLECDHGIGMYSPRNLTAPTLGARLRQEDPESKVVTIAADTASAAVTGGPDPRVFWMADNRGPGISPNA